VSLVL